MKSKWEYFDRLNNCTPFAIIISTIVICSKFNLVENWITSSVTRELSLFIKASSFPSSSSNEVQPAESSPLVDYMYENGDEGAQDMVSEFAFVAQ